MSSKINEYVKITVRASEAAAQGLLNFYLEHGATGTQEEKGLVIGYFGEEADDASLLHLTKDYVAQCVSMGLEASEPMVERLPVEDWSVGWRQYFKPVTAGDRFVVKPPWEVWEDAERDLVIDINPALAFGTGTHETTRHILRLLEMTLKPGASVMDAGTGSAVLAIGAVLLGASEVLAFDVDEDALMSAAENLALNHVEDRISLLCGRLKSLKVRPFDVICANINSRVLLELIPDLKAFCHKDTQILVSGLLDQDAERFEPLFEVWGYRLVEKAQEGEWMGYWLTPVL